MSAAEKKKPVPASVWSALRKRFPSPEWAYFEEVRNGTGFSRRQDRTADALAFGLWPSRGLELHGIEVKVHRSDWLREKKDPDKAEEISRFCDRWWLVTDADVAHLEEIPVSWGWLEFDGKRLKERKAAPERQALPLDRPMIAAILRRASEGFTSAVEMAVQPQLQERMEAEREQHDAAAAELERQRKEAQARAQRAENFLGQVARASGLEFWKEHAYPRELLDELPPEAKEKLEAFAVADVRVLRANLVEAADKLRYASAAARRLLRDAGVRAPALRRGWR